MQGAIYRALLRRRDLLTSGASAPPIITRIAEALRKIGVESVSLPGCAVCKRAITLPYGRDGDRICATCFKRTNKATCGKCGCYRTVALRRKGKPICNVCRSQEISEVCAGCHEKRVVLSRIGTKPYCQACYKRPPAICAVCSSVGPVHSKKTGRPLCDTCYAREWRITGDPPTKRGRRLIRRRCACSKCGVVRLCSNFMTNPLCYICFKDQLRQCSRCGAESIASALHEGLLCDACCKEADNRQCEHCSAFGRVFNTHNARLCARCCYQKDFRCRGCGLRSMYHEDRLCGPCALRHVLIGILGDGNGVVQPRFLALFDALKRANPKGAMRWLKYTSSGQLLTEAAQHAAITHDFFDALPQTKWIAYLRDLLTYYDVLPDRDDQLVGLNTWLDGILAKTEPEIASVLGPFAHWELFRNARTIVRANRVTVGTFKRVRTNLRTARKFLRYLATRGKTLGDARQSDIDDWLADAPTTNYYVEALIRWSNRSGVTFNLVVPTRHRRSFPDRVDEDEQWALIDRLFTDPAIPIRERVAGLFVLLFAQHLSRLIRLTTDHITNAGDHVKCSFGSDEVVLPDLLGQYALDLVALQEASPKSLRRDGARWLFAGLWPGRHASLDALSRALKAYGVKVQAAKRHSQLQLAQSIAPPILASMFGMHINTAVKLHRHARGSRRRYAAMRSALAGD